MRTLKTSILVGILLIGSTTAYVNAQDIQNGIMIEDAVTWRKCIKANEEAKQRQFEDGKRQLIANIKMILMQINNHQQVMDIKPIKQVQPVQQVKPKVAEMKVVLPMRESRNRIDTLSEGKWFGRHGCNTKPIRPYVVEMESKKYTGSNSYQIASFKMSKASKAY